jgi:ABC-type multidrug transport system fused ATPase/permease subunit
VERGRVFIDGVDINDWDLKTLRRQVAFAVQEPFLFSDTVLENIRFGSPEADGEDVVKAAETAALAKDIDGFHHGYDTMVGERGITLSGGQKQRTAIARAVITSPVILVIDDATSSVDTETEEEISRRLKKVLAGRTSFIISHRISSVSDADFILYLEDGKVVEKGSHEELLALNGRYAELYRTQLLEKELEKL